MSKLADELYQRLHGFKTIKREEAKENQSEWYYLDPRYNEGDKRREIDVETENVVNPLLKEVLAYDVNKNPDEYYIWQTIGDEKVRSSHEEHEGYAFNWHVAPDTGHPGEDYNCRCSAISYSPKKHKILYVDLRGLKIGDDEDKLIIIITQADITGAFAKSLEEEEMDVFMPLSADEAAPYVFSQKMRKLLGYKESNNDYTKHNNVGGGIGALGMYQIRRDGLIDTGYLTKDNKWTGKNGINSLEDFLKNPMVQERILNEYMEVQYRYLSHFGETKYVGETYQGIKSKFKITNTGLLAAIHRTGINYMNKFFQNIEKNERGCYYMNYEKIKDSDLKTKFLWIETRLREFEK